MDPKGDFKNFRAMLLTNTEGYEFLRAYEIISFRNISVVSAAIVKIGKLLMENRIQPVLPEFRSEGTNRPRRIILAYPSIGLAIIFNMSDDLGLGYHPQPFGTPTNEQIQLHASIMMILDEHAEQTGGKSTLSGSLSQPEDEKES